MANRVFQNVVYQMKDAVDRVVGVIDETGTVISCSELGQIGEVREGVPLSARRPEMLSCAMVCLPSVLQRQAQ